MRIILGILLIAIGFVATVAVFFLMAVGAMAGDAPGSHPVLWPALLDGAIAIGAMISGVAILLRR